MRPIENLTLGAAAVGYRTESMHGAGSPQAQRTAISRQGNLGNEEETCERYRENHRIITGVYLSMVGNNINLSSPLPKRQ